ncbi:MAG: hypothetical protein LQ346_004533 [Caloplaca aetnensis]|nr:MAG: hypothetical protein LQ346_004533 [Caloplaca aetnensis]
MSTISNLTVTDAPHWNTSENHGPLVNYLTWFFIISAFLAVSTRIYIRYAAVRQVRWDDAAIVVAMLLAVGHSIATSLQAGNGLGRHIDSISSRDITDFQKSLFASEFLYIATVSAVKISICFCLNALAPIKRQRSIILALEAFIGLWTLSSVFVVAFRCQLPQTWRFIDGKCIDIYGFWAYYHAVNILTDVALIVVPCLVIAITVVQIYYLRAQAAFSKDPTYDLWSVSLLGVVVCSASLITACIPYLKPFLEALETGMIRADRGAVSRLPTSGYTGRGYIKYGDSSKRKNDSSSNDTHSGSGNMPLRSLGASSGQEQHIEDGTLGRQTATVVANGRRAGGPRGDSDNESQDSQSKIITKTVGWSVTDEPQPSVALPPHTHLEYPPAVTEDIHAFHRDMYTQQKF